MEKTIDILELKDIPTSTVIGIHPHEKCITQTLQVTLRIGYTATRYIDAIEQVLDYASIWALVRSFGEQSHYELIETFAQELMYGISQIYPQIQWIETRVTKAQNPAKLHSASIELHRTKEELVNLKSLTPKNLANKYLGTQVYLGLGSNLGNRKHFIFSALRELGKFLKYLQISSIIETPPWGNTDQPHFLNCVVSGWSCSSPEQLLQDIHQIEDKLWRVRVEKWGPRTIDIDILYFGESKRSSPDLTLPHPYLQEREFVTQGLGELKCSWYLKN